MHHHYHQPRHYLRGGGGRDGKTGRRSEVNLVRPEYDAVWSLTATVLLCLCPGSHLLRIHSQANLYPGPHCHHHPSVRHLHVLPCARDSPGGLPDSPHHHQPPLHRRGPAQPALFLAACRYTCSSGQRGGSHSHSGVAHNHQPHTQDKVRVRINSDRNPPIVPSM